MNQKDQECEICGQPGVPSWGGSMLCESCYGTLGATCAGIRKKPRPAAEPSGTTDPEPGAGVC